MRATAIKTTTAITAAITVAAVAMLAACSPPPPPLSKLARNDVVLALGDSITSGYGVGANLAFPAQLQSIIKRRVVNAGIPGDTAARAAARLNAAIDRARPSLLIVCIGGNDFLRGVPVETTEKNLRKILQTAKERKLPAVLVGVPRKLPLPLSHPLFSKLASEYEIWLEDDILKTVLHNGDLKSDFIHPNAAGQRKIAEALAALLKKAGAI